MGAGISVGAVLPVPLPSRFLPYHLRSSDTFPINTTRVLYTYYHCTHHYHHFGRLSWSTGVSRSSVYSYNFPYRRSPNSLSTLYYTHFAALLVLITLLFPFPTTWRLLDLPTDLHTVRSVTCSGGGPSLPVPTTATCYHLPHTTYLTLLIPRADFTFVNHTCSLPPHTTHLPTTP